jgi:uncharacterized protein GlcG (DUF336 family)
MQTFESIGLKEARAAGDAVINKAIADKERPVAVAVCGSKGDLIYFAKMDGTLPVAERMSINKAYTAAFWGRKTEDLMEGMKKRGRELAWYGGDPRRETVIPGGAPIAKPDGTVVGGIGVGGKLGPDPKDTVKDYDLAKVGVEAIKL